MLCFQPTIFGSAQESDEVPHWPGFRRFALSGGFGNSSVRLADAGFADGSLILGSPRYIVRAIIITILVGGLTSRLQGSELDFEKWKQLRPGMTEADVVRMLGQPEDRYQEGDTVLVYGTIVPAGQVFPRGIGFRVWLDKRNVVYALETPFGEVPPRRGIPSTPEIFLPQNNILLKHYPRLLDIRWYPVSGTYPVSYEVAYEFGIDRSTDTQWIARETLRTSLPYLSLQHTGAQPGRVRVRAINADGTGPWSAYVNFRFSR